MDQQQLQHHLQSILSETEICDVLNEHFDFFSCQHELCKRPNDYQGQCRDGREPMKVFVFKQVFIKDRTAFVPFYVIFTVSFLLEVIF